MNTQTIEARYLDIDVTKDDGLSDEERRQLFRGVVLLELEDEMLRIAALRGLTMTELADAAEAMADTYRDMERISRRRSVSSDKCRRSAQTPSISRCGIAPAQVERKVRNVEFTDQQYDDFARIAGRMTKMRLDTIVRSPDWQSWPNHIRHDVISEVIRQSRESARGMMMMKYPQIAHDAVEARRQKFTGEPRGIE
jgi:hypothetical protein